MVRFPAVSGHYAVGPRRLDGLSVPIRTCVGMIAHTDDADVGPSGQFLGGPVGVPALETHFRLCAVHGCPDPFQRADAVGWHRAVPVFEDGLGTVAEDSDLLDGLPVEGEEIPVIFWILVFSRETPSKTFRP